MRGELFLKAAELQAQGKEIIFTNGAFPLRAVRYPIACMQHTKDNQLTSAAIQAVAVDSCVLRVC